MRTTPKETYKQILTNFDWSEVGCVVSEDNHIFSFLFDSFIGRLTTNGLEDRRFVSRGKHSQLNNISIVRAIAKMPKKFKCLFNLDPEDNRYAAFWEERNALLKDVLASGLDTDFMKRVLDYLVEVKEAKDAEIAAFEKSIAPYKEMLEAQEAGAKVNSEYNEFHYHRYLFNEFDTYKLRGIKNTESDYKAAEAYCERTGYPTAPQLASDEKKWLFIKIINDHYMRNINTKFLTKDMWRLAPAHGKYIKHVIKMFMERFNHTISA